MVFAVAGWLGKRQLCAGVVVVMVWSQFLPFAYACTTFAVLFLGLVEFSAFCNVMLCVCVFACRQTGWLADEVVACLFAH